MNLLVDARPLVEPSGGVQRVAAKIVEALARRYPELEIFCLTTGWRRPSLPKEISALPNIHHLHRRIPNKLWSIGCILYLFSFLKTGERRAKQRMDTVFFPNVGFIGRRGRKIPNFLLIHDLSFLIEPEWFTKRSQYWHRYVRATKQIKKATHLFSVSQTTADDATRLLKIPAERIHVLPIGPTFPLESLKSSKKDTAPHRYALVLGAGDARKNVETAIAAVRLIRQDPAFRDLHLAVIGKPLKPQPKDPWIKTISRPSDSELAMLYTQASVFLYPSWYEGFGLPLHEAALFETPRIASTSGALPETAPPGTLFANPAKPHQWEEALRTALTAPRPKPIPLNQATWVHAAEKIGRPLGLNSAEK